MDVAGLLSEELMSEPSRDTTGLVTQSDFMKEAENLKLWHSGSVYGGSNALTIFVPMSYNLGDAGDHFEEPFNRHVVSGMNRVYPNNVQQLTSNANIVFALCPVSTSSLALYSSAQTSVGGVPIQESNITYNGCLYHFIDGVLPDIRPVQGDILKLRTCYLAGEVIELQFLACGLKPAFEQSLTLVVSTTQEDCTPMAANQKMGWHGNGTMCSIVVPPVKTRTNMVIWLSIYDNQLRHPIITTTFPWCMVVQPNINLHTNPVITDIIPKCGKPNSELWIKGNGFDAHPRAHPR